VAEGRKFCEHHAAELDRIRIEVEREGKAKRRGKGIARRKPPARSL